jgi:hypothetical protein
LRAWSIIAEVIDRVRKLGRSGVFVPGSPTLLLRPAMRDVAAVADRTLGVDAQDSLRARAERLSGFAEERAFRPTRYVRELVRQTAKASQASRPGVLGKRSPE